MFQTGPNLALQRLGSDALDAFMLAVSGTGTVYVLTGLACAAMLGIDLRRGLWVLMALLLTVLASSALKEIFGLPRPFFVDARLDAFGAAPAGGVPFTGRGAAAFWSLPADDVVAAYRSSGVMSFGLPSGHVSHSVALWGALALLFRRRWLWIIAIAVAILMMLSRMYLARHFLADVVAGFALGGAMLAAVHWAVRRIGWDRALRPEVWLPPSPAGWGALAAVVGAPLILSAAGLADWRIAGALLGVTAGLLALAARDLPRDDGAPGQRLARVGLGLALLAAFYFAAGALALPWPGATSFLKGLLPAFAVVFVAPALSRRLRRHDGPSPPRPPA